MILPSGVAVMEMGLNENWDTRTETSAVAVFDAVCNDDFDRIAAHLPHVLGLPNLPAATLKINSQLLVVCGSLNPITRAQLEFGEQHGCVRCSMSMEQLLDNTYLDSPDGMMWLDGLRLSLKERRTLLLDTVPRSSCENKTPVDMDNARVRVAAHLGQLMIKLPVLIVGLMII